MPQSLLKRAVNLLRRKRFPQVIRLMESQIFRFRQNPEFFFLLGVACLYSGDYGGAESYLRRSDQLKPQNAQTLLGLAAIHARRGETEEALEIWLKIIELQPGCRQAARGLERLRAAAASENADLLRDPKRIVQLYPPLPLNRRAILIPVLAVVAAAVVSAGLLAVAPRIRLGGAERPGIREVLLAPGQPRLAAGTDSTLILTEAQVQDAFERIKRYLLQYRDNLAVREINRILASNASIYVKEKARLLKTFVREPDFTTMKDSFTYSEVIQSPALYDDCYVLWSGKVANVRVGPEALSFDLLVGYQDERELQGVVPVRLEFAFDLDNGTAVEVLGKILFRGGALTLQGRSLHRLYNVK